MGNSNSSKKVSSSDEKKEECSSNKKNETTNGSDKEFGASVKKLAAYDLMDDNNKAAVDMQQRWGFELKPGASRLEMIKNNVKNRYFTLPVGQTEEEYLSKSIEQIRESSEGFQIETKDEEKYWLATVVGLEDGSYISTYTDISELKSQEKELQIAIFESLGCPHPKV